jgi:hypothetical protein
MAHEEGHVSGQAGMDSAASAPYGSEANPLVHPRDRGTNRDDEYSGPLD